MDHIRLYEINAGYVDYLVPSAPHLFRNKQPGQHNERKYIGIVLRVNGLDYFAPLSSFKEKHRKMREGIDFMKVKDYAVINLNNMFPVPLSECAYVDIAKVKDQKYRSLLLAEYRAIKSMEEKIRKNAQTLYQLKIRDGDASALCRRCNDFSLLERLCREYTETTTTRRR